MRLLLTILLAATYSTILFAQCLIEPWSLEKRINKSAVVLEGRVVEKHSLWDAEKKNIYTINKIEVYKVFSGAFTNSTIEVVTIGGVVGTEALEAHPSLQLELSDVGVFMLKLNNINFLNHSSLYKPTASTQSFIKYDESRNKGFDIKGTYVNMEHQLYGEIQGIVGEAHKVIKHYDADATSKKIKALAPPTISSFSTASLTSGSGTELTITGSNFGFARGSGRVGFRDANFGDGRFYYSPTGWSYTKWSNSEIKVIVPSRAATGVINVVNNAGESGESIITLSVDWAHSNIIFPLTTSDTIFYETQHIDDNSTGGYTWEMTNQFDGNEDARGAFIRSLEEWRCETQMPWIVGPNTSSNDLASDDINIVRFTEFGDSRLGVCYSRYSGCFINSRTDMRWYVTETDIEFDSTYNWSYSTENPNSNQFDFESVCTHELGHGHQLGHVNASEKVMHYSISNGQRKPFLVPTDIACGTYIKDKGVANAVCGRGVIVAVPNGSCALSPPTALFSVSDSVPCPGSTVVFTDDTEGDASSYAWDFGNLANPATASGKGPHSVTYPDTTEATIRLIVTNGFGSDTIEKSIVGILFPISKFTEEIDGTRITFTNESENGDEFLWTFGDGATSSEMSPVHNYADKGDFVTSLRTSNKCGDSITSKDFSLSFNVGVNEFKVTHNVFPNPVKSGGEVHIQGNRVEKYSVHTLDGRLVESGHVLNNKVTLGVLNAALYTFTIYQNEKSATYRLQVIE